MTATLRRMARNAPAPEPYASARTCRPCAGTGVGEGWGTQCQHCAGTGEARPDGPPRLVRRAVENEPPRPTNHQLDRLGRLIDRCHPSHPEVHFAADLIGRTDATEAQVLAAIGALEVLVPPTRRARLAPHPRNSGLDTLCIILGAPFVAAGLICYLGWRLGVAIVRRLRRSIERNQ